MPQNKIFLRTHRLVLKLPQSCALFRIDSLNHVVLLSIALIVRGLQLPLLVFGKIRLVEEFDALVVKASNLGAGPVRVIPERIGAVGVRIEAVLGKDSAHGGVGTLNWLLPAAKLGIFHIHIFK